jgi:hypothetical protein
MARLEMWRDVGVRVTLANGDTFKSDARKYEIHPATGVLVLADRERTAPGTWCMVRMITEQVP